MIQVVVASIAFVAGLTVAVVPFWAAAADRRRDRYAKAARVLVEWLEFPFRIARRTSDEASVLRALADLGHDLQERLAEHEAWLTADSMSLGQRYVSVARQVKAWAADAARSAWDQPPVTAASGMNTGLDPVPPQITKAVQEFAEASLWRFGVRRLAWWRS